MWTFGIAGGLLQYASYFHDARLLAMFDMRMPICCAIALGMCFARSTVGSDSASFEKGMLQQCKASDASDMCGLSDASELPKKDDRPWLGWQRPDPTARRIAVGASRWEHHFRLMAALRADAPITALVFVVRGRGSTLLALADEAGILMLTTTGGRVLAEWDSGCPNVTALTAYESQLLGSVILSGHANGTVMLHSITFEGRRRDSEEEAVLEVAPPRMLHAEAPKGPPPPATHQHVNEQATSAKRDVEKAADEADRDAEKFADAGWEGGQGEGHAVTHLLSQQYGPQRQIAALQSDGRITVWRGDGHQQMAVQGAGPFLAARWSDKGSLALVTPSGGAILLTRPSPLPPKVWPKECAGLSGSQLAAAAFDPQQPLALHAVATDGSLLYLSLGNPLSMFGCAVRHKQAITLEVQGRVRISAVSQFLVAATAEALLLVNTSGTPLRAPQAVLLTQYAALVSRFPQVSAVLPPLPLVEAREDLLAVTVAADVVALYWSQLPRGRQSGRKLHLEMWARPLAFVLLVIGVFIGMAHSQARSQHRQAGGAGDIDMDALLKQLGGNHVGGALSSSTSDDAYNHHDDCSDDLQLDILENLLKGEMRDSVSVDFNGAPLDFDGAPFDKGLGEAG